MDEDERERLDEIHDDVREVKRQTYRLDERTKAIDDKTDRIDERVFGRDGIESDVQQNAEQISRLHAIGGILVSAVMTVVAKVFQLIP